MVPAEFIIRRLFFLMPSSTKPLINTQSLEVREELLPSIRVRRTGQAHTGKCGCTHVYTHVRDVQSRMHGHTQLPGGRVKSPVMAHEDPALGPFPSLTRALRCPPLPLPPSLKGGVSHQLRLPNHRFCIEIHITLIITEASPGQADRLTVFRL